MTESGLFVGTLRHRRFRPVSHEFTYPLFMAYLDIDRLEPLMKVSRLAGYNCWRWASYYEHDHFGDPSLPLRERLTRDAYANGVQLPAGRIFLLTHLRYLGYNFNPVSFFYCFDQNDKLGMVVAEVNNTFGETANYWLGPQVEVPAGENKKYRFGKAFHVSPFMKLGHEYEWTLTSPCDRLVTECINYEDGKVVFDSTMKMAYRPWTGEQLHRTLLAFPWMTAKVIGAIHWQALMLKLKKVPVVQHPGPGVFQRTTVRNLGGSWGNR